MVHPSHACNGGSRYRLTIMPNEPSERDRDSRQPHARPIGDAAGSSDGPRRQGGGLRKPAGAGIVVVALVALTLAVTGVFASPNRSLDGVAVAGATHAPTDAPAPDATPQATAEPTEPVPAPTEAPAASFAPAASPTPVPALDVATAKRLQKAIDEFRTKTGIPGISVAIVWDDGRSWAGATGHGTSAASCR